MNPSNTEEMIKSHKETIHKLHLKNITIGKIKKEEFNLWMRLKIQNLKGPRYKLLKNKCCPICITSVAI